MAKAKTFDIYEVHKADYVTPKTPVIVEMKPARYLAIVGQGEPGRKGFQAQVGATGVPVAPASCRPCCRTAAGTASAT